MEEIRSYQSYRAQLEMRNRELDRTRYLEQESNYYSSKIKKDLKNFIAEGSMKKNCSMKTQYNNLLNKSLKKNIPSTLSYSILPTFKKY